MRADVRLKSYHVTIAPLVGALAFGTGEHFSWYQSWRNPMALEACGKFPPAPSAPTFLFPRRVRFDAEPDEPSTDGKESATNLGFVAPSVAPSRVDAGSQFYLATRSIVAACCSTLSRSVSNVYVLLRLGVGCSAPPSKEGGVLDADNERAGGRGEPASRARKAR
jgi:hypothetical protein